VELGRLGSGVICRVKAVCHLLRPQQFWTLANVLWASSTAGAPCYGSFNHDSILFFLGAFAKLRKNDTYLRLVCPSVRLSAWYKLGSHWTDFHEVWCLNVLWKYVEKCQCSLKSNKNKWCFTWRPIYIFIICLSIVLKVRNISYRVLETIKTNILFTIYFFFSKILSFVR